MAHSAHRYQVGRQVLLAAGYGYARPSGAVYEIVAQLPADQRHFKYRIRSSAEAFERVAAENELRPVAEEMSDAGERV